MIIIKNQIGLFLICTCLLLISGCKNQAAPTPSSAVAKWAMDTHLKK